MFKNKTREKISGMSGIFCLDVKLGALSDLDCSLPLLIIFDLIERDFSFPVV